MTDKVLTKSLYKTPEAPIKARVDDLLQQMTLREKLGQLTQIFSGRKLAERDPESDAEAIRKGEVGAYIWAQFNAPLRNRIQRFAVEDSRLGIPLIFGMDIIHGNRTTFPIPLGLSCAFEPELFEKAQTIAARESAAEGIDWAFTPMCDLSRDIRWGRVAETCGEDPYLNSLCTAAQVRGLQGQDPSKRDRIAACLKHFVGYGASMGGRDYNETEITEWTLRNGHLPSFKAGVDADALTIMSSFNAIGGIPAAANHHTLTEILRDEWGFKGFVVSDWNAVCEMINWGYASDRADASSLALAAGNDMDMLTNSYLDTLEQEVEAGRFSVAPINLAVRRVLSIKFELGLFDRPYVDEKNWNPDQLSQDGIEIAKETAIKSVVLLKNEGSLPLSPTVKKVGLVGPFGDDPLEMLGCWSERGRPSDVITLAEGLKHALAEGTTLSICHGCALNTLPRTKTLQDGQIVPDEDAPRDDSDLNIDEAVALAKSVDVVVMALGEPRGWTGEQASRSNLGLTGNQQKLFDAVAATGTPIVTVLFSGRPLIVNEVLDESDAVLCAWQPGIRGGEAIAELLTGQASPSGRLTISVPHSVGQVPIYYNRPKTGRPNARNYRDLETVNPRFHFGYGLTYTSFNYSEVSLEKDATGMTQASATITNTGKQAGTETVQMYVRQLACHSGARPEQELRGFQRVHLQAGESATISFKLDDQALGFTNLQGDWQVDTGNYHIWIAPHAHCGEPITYSH
ncbi:glycoside hydrolase family 3 N-terminal domain-containing protein [Coraliomargarita algicola]|uniref:beta-glucosidase n=1 Tax=Coraliomargarita algicola TaxID=3092156 RepID=A0ABZ0RKW2_9BACT|nr:glycoside hydrolase family 3 N-terminal domain-containing protein [Coraliomargarita sp. J2-16]WPJ96078.1 glycoside hydrolase family 3 N-terminal domain-containing protein [Coraliomargarita sp. J2-16]